MKLPLMEHRLSVQVQEQNERIQQFHQQNQQISSPQAQTWIGLKDSLNIGGSDTDRFLTVPDGTLLEFTNSGNSIFPWRFEQPNDGGFEQNDLVKTVL